MNLSYLSSLGFYLPEVLVTLSMVAVLFLEATYRTMEKARLYVFITALIGCLLALVFAASNLFNAQVSIFTGSVTIDHFSSFMKIFMIMGALGAIYLSFFSKDIYDDAKSEFVALALGVLVGGMLLASSTNFLTLYLGIETLSILSYVLASIKKSDELSSEAGLKYVLYGGVTAGVMLFGMSHIYGLLGTIHFSELKVALASVSLEQQIVLIPSFLLFFAGLGYKISSVPFHMWAPDVYEGSPIPVTAFFSIVPKLAGLAVLLRVSHTFFLDQSSALAGVWIAFLSVIAALTMTVGNVSAINQKSVKRMLAFSSISHAGMMMMAILTLDVIGLKSLLYYAFVYIFMTLVCFFVTSFISDEYGNDHMDRFAGLVKKHPYMALIMTISLFSLAGLPPFAGFVAKFNIFSALVAKKYYGLALVAAINSVIALYYYMYLIRVMMLKETENTRSVSGFGFQNQLVTLLIGAPILLFGLFWDKLIFFASHGSLFIP
jgi:NADH-quinone oxidoreductase subunit N